MMKHFSLFLIMLSLMMTSLFAAEQEVVIIVEGVFIGTITDKDETEQYRRGAIDNALYNATVKVSGAIVNSRSLSDKYRFRVVENENDKIVQKLKSDKLFNNSVLARSEGVAHLNKIIDEKIIKGKKYWIKAEVGISEKPLKNYLKEAGLLWQRAGIPSIGIEVAVIGDDISKAEKEAVADKFRDSIAASITDMGIPIVDEGMWRIKVAVHTALIKSSQYDLYVAKCSYSCGVEVFEHDNIQDVKHFSGKTKRTIESPQLAGFDTLAEKNAKKCASKVQKGLVEYLNDIWLNGQKLTLVFSGITSEDSIEVIDQIKKTFLISKIGTPEIANSELILDVIYRGGIDELATLLSDRVNSSDFQIELDKIENNTVYYNISKNEK